MSPLRVSLLVLLFLLLSGFVLTGCDEDSSPTKMPPHERPMANDLFPLKVGDIYQFENHVDGEMTTTETWSVLSVESLQGRAAYEVEFTLFDLDDGEIGSDTTWYAYGIDSLLVFNEASDEWELDPFLSGWAEADPPATHEFTRVREDLGGLTVEYVAGFHGYNFQIQVGSTTYDGCARITEDATVVGQDHTVSGVRYYGDGFGLVYSDLTDTYRVGNTEITIHREKFRVE